jgi:hypothetical protein
LFNLTEEHHFGGTSPRGLNTVVLGVGTTSRDFGEGLYICLCQTMIYGYPLSLRLENGFDLRLDSNRSKCGHPYSSQKFLKALDTYAAVIAILRLNI